MPRPSVDPPLGVCQPGTQAGTLTPSLLLRSCFGTALVEPLRSSTQLLRRLNQHDGTVRGAALSLYAVERVTPTYQDPGSYRAIFGFPDGGDDPAAGRRRASDAGGLTVRWAVTAAINPAAEFLLPLPLPPPAAPPRVKPLPVFHPSDARTGVEAVEEVIDLVLSRDAEGLGSEFRRGTNEIGGPTSSFACGGREIDPLTALGEVERWLTPTTSDDPARALSLVDAWEVGRGEIRYQSVFGFPDGESRIARIDAGGRLRTLTANCSPLLPIVPEWVATWTIVVPPPEQPRPLVID